MGMRFRKSVKIAKGVKVNFSKSGASLSLGGRGHSVNFSGRGTRVTAGIPGSGLSYSTKVGGGSSTRGYSSSSRSSSPRPTVQLPKEIGIRMNERGQITIEDGNGVEITDKAVLRKIRSLPQFKAQIVQLEEQRKDKIDELVREAEAENERFISISALSPNVDTLADFEKRYDELSPAEYVGAEFESPMPTESSVRDILRQEADNNVRGFFLTVGKLRKQYVEDHFPQRYSEVITAWENEKNSFYADQEEKRHQFSIAASKECEEQKAFLRALIQGNDAAVTDVFDSWIASCELPVEIFIDYEWDQSNGSLQLDVDLPEIEDLSTTKLVKTDSGNLREKKKTQTELRGEYARLVFGLAVFITANAFNVSPAVRKIVISGYTQRENKEGQINDDYIYSIKFVREMFEHTDFSEISAREFCLMTEHKCNMTSTSLFKTIVPFDAYD